MDEKTLKKLPHITGVVPRFYDREVIYNMAIIINALSDAVNFLNEKVIALEEKLEVKDNADL